MIDASVFEEIRRADPDGFNRQCASEASAHQYSKLYSLTAKHVPAGARVLDWGCGRGHFSYSLVRSGFRVTAYSLEPPPEIFEGLTPSDRARLAFVRGGLDEPRRLPFEDGAFDAAFSVGVLEHVRELGGDEAASLAELRRVLAPGGVFVCYHFPNRWSWIEAASRALAAAGAAPGPDGFHGRRFTGGDVERLCAAAGLRLLAIGRYGFLPRNSFGRLPARLRSSSLVASAVDACDAVLERLFSPVDQNYFFVAKPFREA